MNKEFAEVLLKIQKELPNLKKEADNPFYKSKYVPLDNIQEIVLPVLQKHGVLLIQQPCEINQLPGLKTTLIHVKTGEELSEKMLLAMDKQTPQSQGSGLTYACRYSIAQLLQLILKGEDDDGNTATHGVAKTTQVNPIDTKTEKPKDAFAL